MTASSIAGSAPVPGTPNLWIMGIKRDLLLVVLTPLLIIPLAWGAQTRFSAWEIGIYVAAFGAIGHHLPGMMRAYGDSSLFARFRTRFIVAPIFLVTVSMYYVHHDLTSLTLVLLLWGFWHGLMQVYGFVRIYDAKVGSTARLTARLDFLMCIGWFGLGLLSSGGHVSGILQKYYVSGGPLVPLGAIEVFRGVWVVGVAVVTLVFLGNLLWQWRLGRPPNPVKLLLIASSVAFYWYAMVYTRNPILGIALFEVFHDVQYLAIVWAYNGRLVEKSKEVGSFTGWLFRRAWPLVAVYVVLVLAYGSLGLLVPELIKHETIPRSVQGILIASAFLHFYFDGFIWKVRQRSTREGLGLQGGETPEESKKGFPPWLAHMLKWGLFVIPLLHLGFAQQRHPPTLDHFRNAVAAFPGSDVHNKLGIRLGKLGGVEEARHHFQEALRLDPKSAEAHSNLGALLIETDPEEAIRHRQRAVELQPEKVELRIVLADGLFMVGRFEEAVAAYRRVLEQKPSPETRAKLEATLKKLKDG